MVRKYNTHTVSHTRTHTYTHTHSVVVATTSTSHAGAYELAVFQLKPGYLQEFSHRVLQGLPDRLAMDYPHPLGFWYPEFGRSNQQGRMLTYNVSLLHYITVGKVGEVFNLANW